ncbi:Sulfite reductase [NADPH] flavoprotein alpha-component [Methyloligella halotolerans]|uniref:Sulfite reductase [NADPH] flavoprotein alpha-component n=1 Tax=Methyloligella halotolerans TaxID=1177755 RepID=A0A1E2RVE1_9HYPH|nr:assimilatory sulfite reductase (NADPH) flavoprotein subunit [Methyloligella halotolerans]ODA66019.1 Sulfite reductase [NADPH] flavoprotein alpha-component [Methyloligella halotolerans]
MSALDFQSLGLSEQQWSRIKELANSLSPEQALWLSGYFAGMDYRLREAGSSGQLPSGKSIGKGADGEVAARPISILFGSETGNSRELASALASGLRVEGCDISLQAMGDYKPRELKSEHDVLIVTSTHGEGDPPATALDFFEFLESKKAPELPHLRYSVLALGDSTYEQFCEAGKRLDRRLEQLGAERLVNRVDCDVDYEDTAADWIRTVTERLKESNDRAQLGDGAADDISSLNPASAAIFDQSNPFEASVIDNFVLTGRGSSKETRHVELSVEGSGLGFEPGDALGIYARNDPRLVEKILESLEMAADAEIVIDGEPRRLDVALSESFELTSGTTRFINKWAELTEAEELDALRGKEQASERAAFLERNHIIDIVSRFPAKGINPNEFIAGLRQMRPRLYSIASSSAFAPDEVHLTVATVRYPLNGEERSGIATGHIADFCETEAMLPVYIQPNPRFRLAADDTPILMVGAGTGVAPFRAFMQEREVRGTSGRSWLVFGERNFHTDFLYQTEWQQWLRDRRLNQMDVAFSRDQSAKAYVQHRLAERSRDVLAWLEEGATLYVCGGRNLAPAIHATLTQILKQEGGHSDVSAAEYLGAMQSDSRYQIDVY